jgi:hypothetical protein
VDVPVLPQWHLNPQVPLLFEAWPDGCVVYRIDTGETLLLNAPLGDCLRELTENANILPAAEYTEEWDGLFEQLNALGLICRADA